MTKTIAVANLKGGSGKTTAAVNLCGALVARGIKTLLLDFDPQASASSWVNAKDDGMALVSALQGGSLRDSITSTAIGFDIVPSGPALSVQGVAFLSGQPVPVVLAETIERSTIKYGAVVIDCPPAAGPLVYNALAASNRLLVPCECTQLALLGLADFESIVTAMRRVSAGLQVSAVLPSRMTRTIHAKEALSVLANRYGSRTLPPVPDAAVVRDCPLSGQTLFQVQPTHPACAAFLAAADLLTKRS